MKKFLCAVCVICGSLSAAAQIQTNAGIQYLQCMQKDMSTDFSDLSNTYFLADSLVSFDAAKGEGQVQWKRYRMSPRQAFNLNGYWPVRMQMLDFPDAAYENDPALKIKIEWVSPRTARVRMLTTPVIIMIMTFRIHCRSQLFLEIPKLQMLACYLFKSVAQKIRKCDTGYLDGILEREEYTQPCTLVRTQCGDILAVKYQLSACNFIFGAAHYHRAES